MVRRLSQTEVMQIRALGLTDAYWSRQLGVSVRTVRLARIGKTHGAGGDDTAPRDGTGRDTRRNVVAKVAKVRRRFTDE